MSVRLDANDHSVAAKGAPDRLACHAICKNGLSVQQQTVRRCVTFVYDRDGFWRVAAQMLYWFKKSGLGTTLADVQQMFYKFRSRGMRLHYWP